MSKEFKLLIETFKNEELVNYLLEFTKQNNFQKILFKINSSYFSNSLEVLLSSFNFHTSIEGWDYWNKIAERIRLENKPITALAPDIQKKL